ncbi:MAG TPA: DUF3592 domain-containing protein [Candidatus Dormibacteraeota bacterium]|nr:DUF3592 domain-containing protein [Candidatus Dormibacteraeota bacterium]
MTFPISGPAVLVICLPVAALALVWLAFAVRNQRRFMRKARRTKGVVKSLRARSLGRSSTLIFPIIGFVTDSGSLISAESRTGASRGVYRVGQTVTVLYDPEQPADMRIDSFSSRWVGIMIPAFVMLVPLVMAGIAVVGLK